MSTFPLSTLHKKPSVPESDFAGTVAGGALDGTGFSIGDEVFGYVHAKIKSDFVSLTPGWTESPQPTSYQKLDTVHSPNTPSSSRLKSSRSRRTSRSNKLLLSLSLD